MQGDNPPPARVAGTIPEYISFPLEILYLSALGGASFIGHSRSVIRVSHGNNSGGLSSKRLRRRKPICDLTNLKLAQAPSSKNTHQIDLPILDAISVKTPEYFIPKSLTVM
jgi:hypothetical protein